MSLLRRSTSTAQARPTGPDDGLDLLDWARLRDEVDADPLVEEATERLRRALTSLEARDEWGRAIAWRQVARIALGPLVTELRDSQTAARLLDATRPPAPTAAPPPPEDMLFWPA